MKLQRTTVGLVMVAFVLGGGILLHEMVLTPQRLAREAESKRLFGFEEKEVKTLRIITPGQTLLLERSPTRLSLPQPTSSPLASPTPGGTPTPLDSLPPPSTHWQLKQPETRLASEAAVAFLLNLLRGDSSRDIVLQSRDPSELGGANRLGEFGLDRPRATVEITLADGKQHRLLLGQTDANRTVLYALVDSPVEATAATPTTAPPTSITVRLVSVDLEAAVQRPLNEWYLEAELSNPSAPQSDPQSDSQSDSQSGPSPNPIPGSAPESTPGLDSSEPSNSPSAFPTSIAEPNSSESNSSEPNSSESNPSEPSTSEPNSTEPSTSPPSTSDGRLDPNPVSTP